jgi:hypothetical protein
MTIQNKHVYVYPCRWIHPPHDKIALCICDRRSFFFWFNSNAAFHGIGQMVIGATEHPAITKACFLDLSSVKGASAPELAAAQDRGPISPALAMRILTELANPISTLPEFHRQLALQNLA